VTGHRSSRLPILLLCLLALLTTAAVAHFAFERLPHLEDEVAYLFQAKTIALGRLTVPSPDYPDSFWTPFVLDHQGQRFGKYPPGWPAVLALGELARAAWLVNPLLSAVCLYLVYRLGTVLYEERVGLLAAALGLTSPLFLVLGGSFLSHGATTIWLLLFALWFVWTARGRSAVYALGAGLALGLAFLTRALTAVAFAIPFLVYVWLQLIGRRPPPWRQYLAMAGAAAAVAVLLPAYQWAVTGDPWLNPYLLWWPYDRLGFGPGVGAMPGGHSPYYAWLNLRQDLSRMATDLLGWPALSWLPLIPALALPPRRTRDWALAAPFACLVIAYLFYWIGSPSRLWGPRYYYEGFAGLWLLAALGLVKLWDRALAWQRWLRPALAIVVSALVVVNLGLSIPDRMALAHGFYGITRSQLEPVEEAGLKNAIVLVYAERWLEYGALLSGMGPLLDDDVLYVRAIRPEIDAAVIRQYPDRSIYCLVQGKLAPVAAGTLTCPLDTGS
jgi:4-amino-4-deoxy-L-arabinose transferase-like glycosyltransferase